MSEQAASRIHVKLLRARSGRVAVMARIDAGQPWVQVESILGMDDAAEFAGDLAMDDGERETYIRQAAGEDWGEDAPS